MADLSLIGTTLPTDVPMPGSVNRMTALLVQLLSIDGADTLEGIIIQLAAPAAEDQDKAWLKLTAGGAPEGWFVFDGGDWIAMPLVIPTLDALPLSPQNEQIVKQGGAYKIYRDGTWTTNLYHKDSTANRPSAPADGYLFYDTDIDRVLRYVAGSTAWTTLDGCLGEAKLLVGVSEAEAVTRNPGWAAYSVAGDKFLRVAGSEVGEGDTGGRESFDWKISREYFDWGTDITSGGDGNLGVDNIQIDGEQGDLAVDSDGADRPDSSNNWQDTKTVETLPPFLGVTMIRKVTH